MLIDMTQLDAKLQEYRTVVGQWLDRQRSLERQASEAANHAKLFEARIAGILEARELIAAEVTGAKAPAEAEDESTPRKRYRSLTGHWQQIMQLVNDPNGFDYDELAIAVEAVGHDANRETLRSQMSNYKNSGLVEAAGFARFKMTDAGRRAAGITEDTSSNENGAGDAASDDRDEGVAAPSHPNFNP